MVDRFNSFHPRFLTGKKLHNWLKGATNLCDLVHTYRTIFGEAPWNEGYCCHHCSSSISFSKYLALGDPAFCPKCGSTAWDACHPTDLTISKFKKEFSQDGSTRKPFLIYSRSTAGLKGFSKGFIGTIDDIFLHILHETKEEEEVKRAREEVQNYFQSKGWATIKIGYVSDIAIQKKFRNSSLFCFMILRVSWLFLRECESILLYTLADSPMNRIIKRKYTFFSPIFEPGPYVIYGCRLKDVKHEIIRIIYGRNRPRQGMILKGSYPLSH